MEIPSYLPPYLKEIRRLEKDSHKGQNGKVLLIGGSELFHAASRWSLDVLTAMADMVFYSSVPSNNALIVEAKKEFWDGVVVPRGEVEDYLTESDVILIGPGMTRDEGKSGKWKVDSGKLTDEQWNNDTYAVTNYLLAKYPQKKWVVDAGALQMVDPSLLNENCIITPHEGEMERLLTNLKSQMANVKSTSHVSALLETGVTILLKGEVDVVMQGKEKQEILGGNPGMTKGGTGDVLAGLIAGLYAFTDKPLAAAVVGSFVNKAAGDRLYEKVGPFYKTSLLTQEIPFILNELLYSKR